MDPNTETICRGCVANKYPLKGKFSRETIKRATSAKFLFEDPLEEFGGEHMWLAIDHVGTKYVYGRLDNEPALLDCLKMGDKLAMPISEVEELQFEAKAPKRMLIGTEK